MCDKYTYTSGGEQVFVLPANEPSRKSCTMGERCEDGTMCQGGWCSNPDYDNEVDCKAHGGQWVGRCPNVVPGNVRMLTNANQDPTQISTQCNDNNSQDVQLEDGTIVKYPTQCFAPIKNNLNIPPCGWYDKGGVPLPIPCNDALAEKHGNNYYPLFPDQGGYPQQPEFRNCQNDATGGSCRPFTFQTKIDPNYSNDYLGNLNVFGYWGATNMWDFPELTQIHPAYNQVIISFFHIAKYNGKLAIKCTMQRYGHESIWDDAPPWSVFPDGYSPIENCDNADSSCNSRSQDCCRWMHNGGGDQNFGIAKLIEDIRTWKSAARPDRPRTVLASFGGGSGANVTDPKHIPFTGAFTEQDVVKKDNFVQTVLDFLITWGFDGIDNDYEALGGGTCPIGDPGTVVRKNWEDLYSGLRACNPKIILTAAPFNNQHLWAFINSGFFDEIRPQLYNPGGYQIEYAKPSPQAPDGAADKWVGLLQNIGRSTKANGRGGYINVPGVLLEASCRSGGGRLKKQCWDMGRLANTLIYLNQQGEFGKEGKMMSVGVWDIAQGKRFTDDSFAAAMETITIHLGHASTPEPANLKCYYNKPFVDPCTGTNKCWADCGAKSGGRADGGKDLVDNHCDYWISSGGYCGDGPQYKQDGSIQCRTRCGDCRSGDPQDGGIPGKPCEQVGAYCSIYGYCGTDSDYSKNGTLCGKQNDPCDGKNRSNYCNSQGDPQNSGDNCICKCDDGWTGNRCQTRVPPQGQCTPDECKNEGCGESAPWLCTMGPAKNGCGSEDGWAGTACSKYCDTRICSGGGNLPQCNPGQMCPGQRKGDRPIPCPLSGQCPYLNPENPAQPSWARIISI